MSHYMTDDEIRVRYRDMSENQKRVKILAELNGCTCAEIEQVIGGNDMKKIDNDKAMDMYEKGKSDKEIAAFFNVSDVAICQWRKRNGLEVNSARLKRKDEEEQASYPVPVVNEPEPEEQAYDPVKELGRVAAYAADLERRCQIMRAMLIGAGIRDIDEAIKGAMTL